MKSVARTLSLLLVVNFACSDSKDDEGPFDARPADADEAPDNCSTEMPCDLTLGERASDYVSPVGDIDAWVFDVSGPGKVMNVVVENDVAASPVNLEVVLFDPDQRALENARHTGNGIQRVEIQVVAPKAGQYRVVVRDVANDDRDRLNPYFITVNVLDETDNNEPNDTAAEPTALAAGTPISGTIGFDGDQDWFTIDVPANNLVQIAMSVSGDSMVDLQWALFDSTGTTQIALSDQPRDGTPWPVESRAVGNTAGTYLIRVNDRMNDASDLANVYVLTVDFIAEPDQYDLAAPNETKETATQATPGQALSGYIAGTSDFDWYAVQVTNAPQLIHVRGTMPVSEVDLTFEVLMPDGETWICEQRDGDLCKALRVTRDGTEGPALVETAHVAETNGTYYVLVRDHQDNDYDAATQYSVTIDLPPEPDANENYNLPDDASTAVLVPTVTGTAGTTIQFAQMEGYLSHANDIDWYRLDIPGPVGAAPGQNGDWLIELHLENDGPTPVELEAFFIGTGRDYGGYGQRCRDPMQFPEDPCQYPDAENAINQTFGENYEDCFVVFREITGNGPHYFRMSDLDRDDFDFRASGGAYRFSVTITAGCPVPGECEGVYTGPNGDLCGRP